MAYDTTKLVKLAALKALAEKVNSDYTKKTDFDALNEQVQGLVTAGGEPNVLTSVKVNGVALAIAEKAVDILIATGHRKRHSGRERRRYCGEGSGRPCLQGAGVRVRSGLCSDRCAGG